MKRPLFSLDPTLVDFERGLGLVFCFPTTSFSLVTYDCPTYEIPIVFDSDPKGGYGLITNALRRYIELQMKELQVVSIRYQQNSYWMGIFEQNHVPFTLRNLFFYMIKILFKWPAIPYTYVKTWYGVVMFQCEFKSDTGNCVRLKLNKNLHYERHNATLLERDKN